MQDHKSSARAGLFDDGAQRTSGATRLAMTVGDIPVMAEPVGSGSRGAVKICRRI